MSSEIAVEPGCELPPEALDQMRWRHAHGGAPVGHPSFCQRVARDLADRSMRILLAAGRAEDARLLEHVLLDLAAHEMASEDERRYPLHFVNASGPARASGPGDIDKLFGAGGEMAMWAKIAMTKQTQPIHVSKVEAGGGKPSHTEAEAETGRRWGARAWTEIVPEPMAPTHKGIRYDHEVGFVETIDEWPYQRRVSKGRGSTWEEAFENADSAKIKFTASGVDEVAEALPPPAHRVDRMVRALGATAAILLSSEPFGPLGLVARRRLAKVCAGLRDALDHARSWQTLDMAAVLIGQLAAVRLDHEPMSEEEERIGVENFETGLASLVESIKGKGR